MASNVVYVLHFIYFILRFMNVTIRSDSVDNESTAVPQCGLHPGNQDEDPAEQRY